MVNWDYYPYGESKNDKRPENAQTESGRTYRHEQKRKEAENKRKGEKK